MKTRLIADLWESYRRDVVPANAGPAQVEETKRAFWAGARASFELVGSISEFEETTGVALLESLHGEFLAYDEAFRKEHGIERKPG